MVTFGDAKDSIYRGLRSLPRQPYLGCPSSACPPRIGVWTCAAWPW
jgi:hypothetical protein